MINNKVLNIILAHPDDESFAFSGLIQRSQEKQYTVLLHTLTEGEAAKPSLGISSKAEMRDIRMEELKQVVNKLGITQFQYKLPDGKLESKQKELDKPISKIISQNPEGIFATTFHETTSHPDHKQISIILKFHHPKNLLFHYRPDRWQKKTGTSYQLHLTDKESEVKKEMLRLHKSQSEDVNRYLNNYVPIEYFFCEAPSKLIDDLFDK